MNYKHASCATPPASRSCLLPVQQLRVGRNPQLHLIRRRTTMTLTLTDARAIIDAAEAKALEIRQPMNIAVVDVGGNVISHVRMDGAWLGGIDISINKAFTARAFDIQTKELGENSQPGQQYYGIAASNHGRIIIFAGGIPVMRGGEVIGAVGVSGGTGEQDQTVAEVGVEAASE
jgi:uncharacterized protein GlcG (DUF336 family)